MIILYILAALLFGAVIGYFIGKITGSGSVSRNTLSDSIAKMIYSTVDNTKEYFDSSTQDKDIETISILVSEGNFKEIENMIAKETTIENVTKEIESIAEVLNPDLIKDEEIKESVEIIKLDGEIAKIQDKINIATLTLETIRSNVSSTNEEKEKALQVLNKLLLKLSELQGEISKKIPLETALLKVKDPEKLAHLQEIQTKILSKREKMKKKDEENVKKDNPKIKVELERKLKEKKDKDIAEKQTKIKENIGKSGKSP